MKSNGQTKEMQVGLFGWQQELELRGEILREMQRIGLL